jgi:hypothetical protein
MSAKPRENLPSRHSENFCQHAQKKHVNTFVIRVLPHQNLPLFVPPSPNSPFRPLTLQRGHKRVCDPWPKNHQELYSVTKGRWW